MAGDFLHQLAEAFAAAAAESPTAVARLETDIRRQWGGQRVYIQKASTQVKTHELGAKLAGGTNPSEAIRELGLPLRTGYRLLSRKWPP